MPSTAPPSFDINAAYHRFLKEDEEISPPLASILALTSLIENSKAGTVTELLRNVEEADRDLKENNRNSISLSAGVQLFRGFISMYPLDSGPLSNVRNKLVAHGRNYVAEAVTYREKIAKLAVEFIKDDAVILTHSSSRVVIQTLKLAHKQKRISVYITEARPSGWGLKTADALAEAGIPHAVILDSCVAYCMEKVDFVLVGSESVLESGGLVNAVGSNQIAMIAKACNKPFYALSESYKFQRMFPLSQYDTTAVHDPNLLAFTMPSPDRNSKRTTQDDIIRNNPHVDYTSPDLISLVISDVSVLTPEGVSQYLVGMHVRQ